MKDLLNFSSIDAKQEFIERMEQYILFGILFFIPISTAAPSLFGLVLIILWLWKGQYQESWVKLKSQPIFWTFLAYLLIYPLSLLWSDNMQWGGHVVQRHMIFLMFPFMLMASRYEDIPKYLTAFILGMTFTEFTSYMVWFEWLHLEGVSPIDPTPFYHHTIYNPMLAWGLYLVLHGLLFEKRSLPIKFFFALFATTMTVNMFITAGRGGQIAFFIVTGLLLLQFFAKRGQLIKGFLLAVAFVVGVFTIAYQTSSLFNQRVNLAITEFQNFQPDSHTSVGSRIGFYINTFHMSFDRPLDKILLGSGVGDFPEDYSASLTHSNAVKLYAKTAPGRHTHPHSQYFYELGALGLIGFVVFSFMFLLLIRMAFKVKDNFAEHRVAFVIFMGVIMVSDSLLLAHGTAVLFIGFSALLFTQISSKSFSHA